MKTKRGFTLIELMVVVSIISMLASVVLATIKPVRAQARDAQRKQQVHQIDLAVQSYIADNGYPPELNGCAAQATTPAALTDVSGCIAVSTSATGSSGATAWTKFMSNGPGGIGKYLSSLPIEPCSTCSAASGGAVGYTYIAPLASQVIAGTVNATYQLFAPLETSTSSATGLTGQTTNSLPVINFSVNGGTTVYDNAPNVYWTTVGAAADFSCWFMETPRGFDDPYNTVLGPNPANLAYPMYGGAPMTVNGTYTLSLTCYTGLGRTGQSNTKTIVLRRI